MLGEEFSLSQTGIPVAVTISLKVLTAAVGWLGTVTVVVVVLITDWDTCCCDHQPQGANCCREPARNSNRCCGGGGCGGVAVSYTHLTLPTMAVV